MSQNKLLLNESWKVRQIDSCNDVNIDYSRLLADRNWVEASVPGDIHDDLFKAGIIPDPYYSDNCVKCSWVTESDWLYYTEFTLPQGFKMKNTRIVFKGIDTFSEIWFNGTKLGETDNMFREFSFDISNIVKEDASNKLFIKIRSVKKTMKEYCTDNYFACFNTQRIFLRKAQCHFGWDWAPDFPGTGIWDDVVICSDDGHLINDVNIHSKIDGNVTFKVELNKEKNKPGVKYDGGYEVLVRISGKDELEKVFRVQGKKNVFNMKIADPKLWWPNGYGEQYLYDYEVVLLNYGQEVDRVCGTFGIREVRLIEEPQNDGDTTFQFEINKVKLTVKGANWVPLDSMTGIVKDEKYHEMILKAKQANFNTLRIWGGGIYEKDIFYELCDKLGIMVWQDFMFACSDIPDNHPWFVEKIIPEIEYQVKRLRNYTSLVYWCGGNEKTGNYGALKSYGDRTFHYTIRGICNDLDPTRPYGSSSPYSYTDLGNDFSSGDTHCSSYHTAVKHGIKASRETLDSFKVAFASEIAVQGPSRMSTLKKFIPEEKMWPVNDVWDLHFTRNPYDESGTTFIQQQLLVAEDTFGAHSNVDDFVKKGMTVHAEFVKSEAEYHRVRKEECGGIMFWMYSDVWPSGTWALVDYYGVEKPAYYAAKRIFAPVVVTIQSIDKKMKVHIINDTLKEIAGKVEVGQVTINGNVLWTEKIDNVSISANSAVEITEISDRIVDDGDSYLFARLVNDGKVIKNLYFHNLWKDIEWSDPCLTSRVLYYTKYRETYKACIEVSAEKFARMVNINLLEGSAVYISDNFFDMESGEKKIIEITSDKPFDVNKLRIDHWLTEWN